MLLVCHFALLVSETGGKLWSPVTPEYDTGRKMTGQRHFRWNQTIWMHIADRSHQSIGVTKTPVGFDGNLPGRPALWDFREIDVESFPAVCLWGQITMILIPNRHPSRRHMSNPHQWLCLMWFTPATCYFAFYPWLDHFCGWLRWQIL